MLSSSAESKAAASETRTVVVARGDTLWSIAERHAPKGTDLRQYVFAMRKLNNLSDAMILPGQTITLP
ncbi:MAG: LysM peptidoglycan-binding domain-containing protein [Bacillota bacterium]